MFEDTSKKYIGVFMDEDMGLGLPPLTFFLCRYKLLKSSNF